MEKTAININTGEAMFVATLSVFILGLTIIGFDWVPHLSVILVISMLLLFGKIKGVSFDTLQAGMANGLVSGAGAIYLFFFIGLLVSALMMSGSIPTLMYYGFTVISPHYFYISVFAITSLVGVLLGSSFTTCATLGVTFMGMSDAFGANPAIIAGAIVSGAFFGDKMSPLSDTTNIAASIVGIDLFEHIRNMMYTTVPAWILTALFLWLLADTNTAGSFTTIDVFKNQLLATQLINVISLLPFVVLIVLALAKVNAIYTIICSILTALIIAIFFHQPSISEIGNFFFQGYKLPEGVDLGKINSLVSRGGINSMFFTQTIIILALSLGGLLQALGILPALLSGIAHMLTSTGRATLAVATTALGVNFLVGEQYLSLLLAGTTFRPIYERLGLHPRNIARTIEDAGTVINPLVPWGVSGVFISHVLNIPVLTYLPYAFFCYLCLILTIMFGFTGVSISKK